MKDLAYLFKVRRELTELIRLRRKWDRYAKLKSTSPKIWRLRLKIDGQTNILSSLITDL